MWWVYTRQVKDDIGVVNLLFTDQYFMFTVCVYVTSVTAYVILYSYIQVHTLVQIKSM